MDIQNNQTQELFEKLYVKNAPSWALERDSDGSYKYHATQSAFSLFEQQQAEIELLKSDLAKAQAVPEGFVLLSRDNFESLNEFKDLYKRAIINARKRKHQLNWAHVAGLGVGSGRAVKLCKMLGIDPCATNMYEVVEAQEQTND